MSENTKQEKNSGFGDYLKSSMNGMFSLDLSNCTVMSALTRCAKWSQNYKLLKNKVTEIEKMYELISSHTARRSFANINTLRNIPRSKILRATGHSSENAFNRYICYDDDA